MKRLLSFILLILISTTAHGDGLDSDTVVAEWPYMLVDDNTILQGADGVDFRVGDDGDFYIASSWEESGVARICRIHSASLIHVKEKWQCVSAGENKSVEFVALADFNHDGAYDAVSAGEYIKIHIAPENKSWYLNEKLWTTYTLHDPSKRKPNKEWMHVLAIDVNKDGLLDILAGGKKGFIGWFESPLWNFHPINSTRWTMELYARDMDDDGDQDIILSDNAHHPIGGIYWLENPGPEKASREMWMEHEILQRNDTRMIDVVDVNDDGLEDVVTAATNPDSVHISFRKDKSGLNWNNDFKIPLEYRRELKDVAVVDINRDGSKDLLVSTVNREEDGYSLYYISNFLSHPEFRLISTVGRKDDMLYLFDFDADGDLDILTTIERPNVGVIIFFNPLHKR